MISKSSTAWIKAALAVCAVSALAGCAAGPSAADNPILRKFEWFSYMEGGDFKKSCAPGQPARYRMIYNAVYTEQVRVYDFSPDAGRLDARVIQPMDMRNFYVQGVTDLLNPWRGTTASRAVEARLGEALVAALDQDGAFGAPAVGTELPSMGFFWTIAACHDGRYHFTGLAWPSAKWDQTHFADMLFSLDPISIPVNPPRPAKIGRDMHGGRTRPIENDFVVKVGENGLADFEPLF